ncbi:MAG: SpoIVB peptidase [Clostridia bacterium]|nr:SpoIVB peptidase [Clostridia bacterium]MDD4686239.1 SpoIVB peptidase [Clostridia bacterium]
MKKIATKFLGVILAIAFIIMGLNINFSDIFSLPSEAVVSYNDIDFINKDKLFGEFVQVELSDIKTGTDKNSSGTMWLKLFGCIPIKQINVEINKGEDIFIGGIPLGFAIKTKGVLVVGSNTILSADGGVETVKSIEIKEGDIILKINDKIINDCDDIPEILSQSYGKKAVLSILRNGEILTCDVVPEQDFQSGDYKIGLWVKDDASGIGTLTFIKKIDNSFGALGHAITDFETGVEIPVQEGKIYKCNLIGINKAEKNSPGELRCVFLQGVNGKGIIEKNTKFGVYGKVTELDSLVDNNLVTEIGSRMTIKTGKAKIVSSVSGMREEYDIEIIKTSYQPESNDKSFVFRVTDSRLLKLTGGILQGMSGSPILQNGKLIGAVTHVFVSDPTKGYGIYADWMVRQ